MGEVRSVAIQRNGNHKFCSLAQKNIRIETVSIFFLTLDLVNWYWLWLCIQISCK